MITKGKIVLIAFPFDDFSKTKIRPVLCLTEPIGKHKHVVVSFITSKTDSDLLDSDILLKSSSSEFESTGLSIDSKIQLHRLLTIPISSIKRELGIVEPELSQQVKEKLNGLLV